jgi:formylglycine-generating enzyme
MIPGPSRRPSSRRFRVVWALSAVGCLAVACRKDAPSAGGPGGASAAAPSTAPLASTDPSATPVTAIFGPGSAAANASAIPSTIPPTAVFAASGAGTAGGGGASGAAPSAGGEAGAFGAEEGPCPASMALVGRACVDRWEAHLATVDESGKLLVHPHNQRPEPSVRYVAVSEPGVFPQGYMSRVEAEAACKEAGKRLCSMNEWRTACGGTKHFTYPYGNRREKDRCSSGKKHLLSELFGTNGKAWKYENFNDPILLATPGYLDETGSHEGCQTDAGVFDMVGNLHEWVKDTVTDEFVERMEAESVERKTQPWHSGNGVFMGGFFSTGGEHGPGCTFTTIAHEPRYHDYSIGFRCCADAKLPKPAKGASKKSK